MPYTDLRSISLTEAAKVLNIAIHDGNTNKNASSREPCPFCGSSSGFVTRDNTFYKCFSCGEHGSVTSLAKRTTNGYSILRKAFTSPNQVNSDSVKLEKIFLHYSNALQKHPEILDDFYASREIDLRQVEVGYATGELLTLKYSTKELDDLGLLSNKNWELWWNHLIFPIRDKQGLLTHFQGRALDNSKLRWLASRLSTPPISSCLYNLNKVKDIKPLSYYPNIFITEGITDTLSLQQLRGKISGSLNSKPFTTAINTTAMGTLGITPDISGHAYTLKNFSICFIYDNTKIAIGSQGYVQGLPNYRSWNSMLPCIIDFYKRRNSGNVFCLQVPEYPGVEDVNDFLRAIEWNFSDWLSYFKVNVKPLEDFVLNYYKDDPKAMRLVGKCISVRRRPEDVDEYSRLLKHHFGNVENYLLDLL